MRLSLSILVLFTGLHGLPQPQALQTGGTSAIHGMVVRAGTNEPLTNAEVELTQLGVTQAGGAGRAITDASGVFVFRDLPAGRYRVAAQRENFVSLEYGQRARNAMGTVLVLADRQRMEGVVLRMTPAPAIAGTVYAPNGERLAAAAVQAYRRRFTPFGARLIPVRSMMTNDFGEYRLYWLEPGDYYVSAGYSQHAQGPAASGLRLSPNLTSPDGGYVTLFHPGQPYASMTQPVRVGPGDASNVDIRFQDLPTFSVRGHVLLPVDESEITGVDVAFLPAGEVSTVGVDYSIRSDARGNFAITGVSPGRYVILARAQGRQRYFSEAVRISVANGNIDQLRVPLFPASSISGSVFVEGSGREDLERLTVQLIDNENGTGPGAIAQTARGGRFTLENVRPGNYEVRVPGLPPGAYVKSIRNGGRDVLNSGLRVALGRQSGIQITVSFSAASVDGRVVDRGGSMAPGAQVVLLPVARIRRTDRYIVGTTDEGGGFQIDGIPPGEYVAYAFEQIEADGWYDPELPRRFGGRGVPVTLTGGGRVSVELRWIEGGEMPGVWR